MPVDVYFVHVSAIRLLNTDWVTFLPKVCLVLKRDCQPINLDLETFFLLLCASEAIRAGYLYPINITCIYCAVLLRLHVCILSMSL